MKRKFGYDVFTYPWGDQFRNTCFVMDRDGTKEIRRITDERLDFWKQ